MRHSIKRMSVGSIDDSSVASASSSTTAVVGNALALGFSGALIGVVAGALLNKDLQSSALWGLGIGAAVGVAAELL
jgi:F0F1-type ATP synthase assembly protein I